jgi:DNA-binding CsgD family transcriptional regulator
MTCTCPVDWRKYAFRRIVPRNEKSPLLRLRQRDLQSLLEFLRHIYAAQSLDSFRRHLLTGLQQLVPSEITAYNEVNLRTQHNEVVYDRPEAMTLPDGERIFDRYIPEHPLIKYSKGRRGHGAVKISDFLSVSQFHRLGLYSEFFRWIRVEDQMVMSLPTRRPVVIGIALNRSQRNFTERERLLLDLAYPHLLQACRNAEAWTRMIGHLNLIEDALRESSAAVIVLNHIGQVQTMTPKASYLLAKYLGGRGLRRGVLPELLQGLLARQQIRLSGSVDAPPSREPLVVQSNEGCLSLRLFQDQSQSLLLLEESCPAPGRIGAFGLTRREGEVLAWVGRGKTNRDISVILGTSPRTVQKHVEHIFQKLGVETRTAAAAKVLAHASVVKSPA